MTLIEFLVPLKNSTAAEKCLAALYFLKHVEGENAVPVDVIRSRLVQARVPLAGKMKVSQALGRAGALVDSPGTKNGRKLWALTDSGDAYVEARLGLSLVREAATKSALAPSTPLQKDVESLTQLAADLTDPHVRGYVEEAITCLQAEAFRAAVVFVWSGAIWTLRAAALAKGGRVVTNALQNHQPKAREIKAIEDFAWISDATFLLAAADLLLFDKTQKTMMEQALDLRNGCGHPTKYRPGEKKVSSFIEDVVGIVFN